MSRFMRTLTHNVHFYTAQLEGTPIVIFIADELMVSGVIEDITAVSVKVRGEYYMRDVCAFKYVI
ncbi:hypothetical protein [Paenibacillus sp. J22TS3]|uniref:hypothetical protein n=1 Tax=Paenibacillus sp. J22TS3 TaxID=2807192 RepID=UPI001B2006D1|nr:hypothetical protein [Paenibacillus sp. J22TS3]GIP21047.1 hypothetical protein J22TS3_13220 [Paenibacillus sp. J22TS3]